MKKLLTAGLMAGTLIGGGALTMHLTGGNAAYAQEASAESKQIIEAAKARGEVGEKIDGYLGAVSTLSPAVEAAMDDINISRKTKYEALASSRGKSTRVIAQLTGEALIDRAPRGEYVMGATGQWAKK